MNADVAPGDAGERRRCGFVALLGAPNVGKSTLLNRVVGSKVSIVTPKVQTTRTRVLGIAIRGGAQIAFVDTPGIFRPRRRLDRAMVAAAWGGAKDADAVVVLVDAAKGACSDTRSIVAGLKDTGRKAVAAINKIDLVKHSSLLALAADLNAEGVFTDIFMISAVSGDGVEDLVAKLVSMLPEGPWLYPEDQVSDIPRSLLAAEITREQVYLQLQQELPYAAAVETESWTPFADGSVRIDQVIFVARDSQKPIVVGKGGQRIKSIGAAARAEMEQVFGHRVHLFLHVKVEEWAERREHYRALGLEYDV
ncbi:MAG: GTPase Era [Alphaproteobacteria bacterium]